VLLYVVSELSGLRGRGSLKGAETVEEFSFMMIEGNR
jgi:hypothetical protein